MLKTWLTAKSKGATVKSPNKPTEGSGPRVRPSPFLSVEYVGSCVDQLDKATLADPKSCPNIGDHLTDPPYFGNVQYAELMDFCYVWLRKLVRNAPASFDHFSTRNAGELTGNATMGRNMGHFTEGLSAVFFRMADALKPGAPLAFTYHHDQIEAYFAISMAILDAGLTCSASLPCPAEMGASIHISGTTSSIVDTVLVCRSTGAVARRWISDRPEDIARMAKQDIDSLAPVYNATQGDIRCILFGHLARLAVWYLRTSWDRARPTGARLAAVAKWIEGIGGAEAVQHQLDRMLSKQPVSLGPLFAVHEKSAPYDEGEALVSF